MSDEKLSYEEAIAHLEQIIRQMETGELPLAESLAAYEEGVRLIKHCHGLLKEGERRVLKITGTTDDGQPCLQPFLDTP